MNISALLLSVNTLINHSLIPNDVPTLDFSVVSLGSKANCNNYAATKRAELIKDGIAADDLRIDLVLTKDGRGHSVLVYHDLVLDSLTDAILPFEQTGYIPMGEH